ncbi:MAG: hypothetical protein ACREVZ_13635 [Burkholderiales bacterium]
MNAPEEIHNASHSQFSVARHYGGCKFAGAHYHYDAATDRLIRTDVWQARVKAGKAEGKALAKSERDKWLGLQQPLI